MFFHPQCRNPKIFYCLLDVTNTYSSTFYTIDTWRIYSHIFGKDAQALGVYVDRGIEAREEQDMSQCLRCNKPCEATFVFCDNCQSLLRSQLGQVADTFEEETITFSPLVALSPEHGEISGKPLERITSPLPVVPMATTRDPETPPPDPPSLPEPGDSGNIVEHAVQNLNEAAQRIAQEEQGNRRQLRASRLSPIRDISADIQRQSTVPLPQITKKLQRDQEEDLGKRMPHLWPWLQQDSDPGESESDSWSNGIDPLMARQFPNSAEIARIEEEDLRRAMAEGLITMPIPPQKVNSARRRMHMTFSLLVILAIVALVMDGILISAAVLHPPHRLNVLNGPPSLTLSSNVARIGQTITLHINHFTPSSSVYLTHDIQEAVQLTTGSALINVGPGGSDDVIMLVDASWTPGFHTIEAEDVSTRYTASATLQIAGAGPTRPSHLLIDTTTLDFGADYQGANTIQPLTLQNSGSGSITWSASSNQSWLLLTPPQGMFSESQPIAVAVERANLKAGEYNGKITFSSNVGSVESVQVQMTVRALPANPGPVLEVIPPVLSFTALDGGSDPAAQTLMISNPGSQRLNWSITGNNTLPLPNQALLPFAFHAKSSWLSTDQTAGAVVPRSTTLINLFVHSRNLLPGVYTDVLSFAAGKGVYNSPQTVIISLTIQPRCGLTLSNGYVSFTAVSGQSNPSDQSLSLAATSSCSGVTNWKAVSASNWLSLTPASGQLKGSAGTITAVGVNASILKPGTYNGYISITAAQSTQTVMVQLIVQAPPPPSAPIMGATPLSLNFSTTQGLPNPPGQVVTITNTGKSQLKWHTTVNILSSFWLAANSTGGSIAPGETGQVTVNIFTANLSPNTYIGQIVLIGTDTNGALASGSPQTITVNLLVLPPCTLQQPSQSSVAFTATQGGSDPGSQTNSITVSGNCAWPLNWHATITQPAGWLKVSPASGSLAASGQSVTITVVASVIGLNAGTYSTQISISATDGSNTPVQSFTVTVTVLPPCQLQVGSLNLPFSVGQGQPSPSPQSFSLNETGNCTLPVTWQATGDAASSSWLVVGPPSSGTGSATVSVGVNASSLAPGSYSGMITVSATGNGGAVVQNSPQTVNVKLTVTGYTFSGSVIACSDTSCTTTNALPGSSVSLLNNATNQAIVVTANGSGNFSFTSLALDPYTLTVTGTDGTTNYLGTVSFNMTGDKLSFPVNVYPH